MRYLINNILKDLNKKMVFLGGPRQVGKTTLARFLLEKRIKSGRYFNWDFDEHRKDLLDKRWLNDDRLLIFDELHKYPKWKNWIKGIYDVQKDIHQILVTGSARLDLYKKGGDSLFGRYHYWRLHPFTICEAPASFSQKEIFDRLLKVGGFPEPFLDGNENEARRWRKERYNLIFREDIRDLERVTEIQLMSLLLDALRSRVNTQTVIHNLANDLEVADKTIKKWIEIFKRMYLIFSVHPLTKDIPRSIKKPPKIYFFDNADVVGDMGAKFENLVATTLLKRLNYLEDSQGYRFELRYIRDKEHREVDFVILKEGIIEELIEVKYSDDKISKDLLYYAEKLKPKKATQIVATLKNPFDKNRLRITDPFSYFTREIYRHG